MYTFVRTLSRRSKRTILLGVDLVLAPMCLFFAFCLQQNTLWPSAMLAKFWALFPLITALAGVISVSLGIPSIKLKTYETRAMLKTAGFAALLVLIAAAINGLAGADLPSATLIIFGVTFFSLSVASRLAGLKILLWIYRQGQTCTRVLIYGAGATGVRFVAVLGQSEEIEPVGFVDDNQTLQNMMVAGLQVYSPARIPTLVAARDLDRVVLAMPSMPLPRQTQIARRTETIGSDEHRWHSYLESCGGRNVGSCRA